MRGVNSQSIEVLFSLNGIQMDWSLFCFLPICFESSVFVSVVFVVVVFLRSRRNKKEDHITPEKGKGDK